MSLRHLNALFRPKSVTLVGASNRPKSIGSVVMQNLLYAGFTGPILPVNPKYTSVAGILAYSSITELPLVPDLAIICTPPQTVPGFIQELGIKGTKTILVMSTDLDQYVNGSKQTLRQLMMEYAHQYSMRILGPNCLGVITPRTGLNASFGHTHITQGQIAFVSQSDSLGIAVLDWAHAKGIGFSYFISLGDCADIDFADVIDYLGGDPYTTSILLYIEHIHNARKFISAARSASRNKPIVVIKSGIMENEINIKSLPGNITVLSDNIFDGLFRRAGMLRVFDIAELFDAVETMAKSKQLRGDRLAILSNGGGPAVMAKDILAVHEGQMATLSPHSYQELEKELQNNFFGSNPIRIIDHASSEMYARSLEILLNDQEVDAVIVIHVPTAFASSEDIAGAIVNTVGRSRKNIFTVWLGEEDTVQARKIFALAGIPTYETPDQAVRLFMDMVRYRRNQELLMETPDSVPKEFSPNPEAASHIVKNALAEGRNRLNESETKNILSEYGIPVVDAHVATNTEEARIVAQDIGYPVALKILSSDIKSKQDVGGVILDLETPEELQKATQSMLSRVKNIQPEAKIEGFLVQKMARRPGAHELLAGIITDSHIGPVVIFGQGGAAAKIFKDRAVGLPPLNMTLAKELIQRTQISKLLEGYQGQLNADLYSIRLTLVQLSQLIIDIPEIISLSINPLFADSSGVLALDAQIETIPTSISGPARLAIRPYPEYLEEYTTLDSGQKVLIRPIRPEDEHRHRKFFNQLSQEDVRLRFFGFIHQFSHSQMAKYTQIDYDREMAFIAVNIENCEQGDTIGVIEAYFDPDNITAEFAIVVRTDLKNKGLGTLLMEKIIQYCKNRKTKELVAYTLRENTAMQVLGEKFNFQIKNLPKEPETVELRLKLE